MHIHDALTHGTQQLAGSASPALDARLLLQHVTGLSRTDLLVHADRPVSDQALIAYESLLSRAALGTPLPHLLGHAPFFDGDILVTPDVLIPRPETEELVGHALRWARAPRRQHAPLLVIDVGTGSGCIAVTLARHLPSATVLAGDISAAALAVAQRNAHRQSVDRRLRLVHADLWAAFYGAGRWPGALLVTANLPYVTDPEWTELGDGVKSYEPSLALRGGPDGLDLIRRLVVQIAHSFAHGAGAGDRAVFLEIGWRQGAVALDVVRQALPGLRASCLRDYAGHDRIIAVTGDDLTI